MGRELAGNEILYRFISLEDFLALITSKQEHYVRPSIWEDTFEGYLFSTLTLRKNRKHIIDQLLRGETRDDAIAAALSYERIWYSRNFQFAKCWTTLPESDALWRIYSYDKHAIRISTSVDEIKNTLPPEEYSIPHIKTVDYDMDQWTDQDKLFECQVKQLIEARNAAESYYHKRVAFSHEQEARVIVSTRELFNINSMSNTWGTSMNIYMLKSTPHTRIEWIEEIARIAENFIESMDNEIMLNLDVKIPCINSYIKSVMVHPQAQSWYVNTIKCLCNDYQIENFLGRSNLYATI